MRDKKLPTLREVLASLQEKATREKKHISLSILPLLLNYELDAVGRIWSRALDSPVVVEKNTMQFCFTAQSCGETIHARTTFLIKEEAMSRG